jgi:hypothetical protein
MGSERKSVTRTVDGVTISVTVEFDDAWVIRDIYLGPKATKRIDALCYPSAEEALEAGFFIATSLHASSGGDLEASHV